MGRELKYVDLAKALDLTRAYITMAVKRGNLVVDGEKKIIDIDEPINRLWIEKKDKNNKIYKDDPPIIEEPVKEEKNNDLKPKDKSKNDILEEIRLLELGQKKATLEKTQSAIKLDEIKIKKQEGALIPYYAVKTVFLYSVETFRNTYLQEVNSLANIFIER